MSTWAEPLPLNFRLAVGGEIEILTSCAVCFDNIVPARQLHPEALPMPLLRDEVIAAEVLRDIQRVIQACAAFQFHRRTETFLEAEHPLTLFLQYIDRRNERSQDDGKNNIQCGVQE